MPTAGYPQQTYAVPVCRYCQTLDLRDNPELIAEYRRLHSAEGIWPEIMAGIRAVGILEMEIYLLGTRLFMIVEAPADFEPPAETSDGKFALDILKRLGKKSKGKPSQLIFKMARK
ncbi:MAG: L-rhamnose mutarotase [Alloprevotella sp.]|nr:L-rhamnose mutarotase [Alloprevotella sp.]